MAFARGKASSPKYTNAAGGSSREAEDRQAYPEMLTMSLFTVAKIRRGWGAPGRQNASY